MLQLFQREAMLRAFRIRGGSFGSAEHGSAEEKRKHGLRTPY
ncbi:MAG: hypothetical protein QG656_2481, partial [Candidatus Hydrogenedentes bacterium]|nr:hypothetical protein [Candidatus Hydrogenedentota bacterium]